MTDSATDALAEAPIDMALTEVEEAVLSPRGLDPLARPRLFQLREQLE